MKLDYTLLNEPTALLQRLADAEAKLDEANIKLNPRLWTREMSHAWHINIPDLRKAFEALRDVKQAIEEGES